MKRWLPAYSLGFASFIFVTSEFTPVGLLTEMGTSFNRTNAQTALLMTVYAWVVALLSIPLTAYVSKFNRRPLMLTLLGIFVVAHIMTALATDFNFLLFSRLCVASSHAVFWAIAIPLGIRLAPRGFRERAIAIVATGATTGGVLGIPFGTYLGQIFGWRLTFAVIGVCAALIALLLFRLVPSTPSQNPGNLKSFIPLMKRKDLILVYLMTVIMMTGHFCAYTFISPYLLEIGGMEKEWISTILLVFGGAGFIGSFFAPSLLKRHFRKTAVLSSVTMAFSLIALRGAVVAYPLMLLLVLIWGGAFIFFNLVLQNLVLAVAPDAEDVAMAGYSGIFNLGIGGGALTGSIASTHFLFALGYIGAVFVALAILICIYIMQRPFISHLENGKLSLS